MNKARKFKKLELLNFEGPVLMAHKSKDVYIITDERKEIVDVLIGEEMQDYVNGEFSIVDSKGRSWLYTRENADAKPNIKEIEDFIKS